MKQWLNSKKIRNGRRNCLSEVIILFLLFLIFSINNSFASFLDDTSKYIKFDSDISSSAYAYVDKNSIQVLRYDPPFYIIQGNWLIHFFRYNKITYYTDKYYYDINKHEMQYQVVSISYYDEAGNLIEGPYVYSPESPFSRPENVSLNTVARRVGNIFFYKAYTRAFDYAENEEVKKYF